MELVTGRKSPSSIQHKIHEIRGVKVMLDFDLAEMYGILTKRLKEQVRRNIERFPEDFMFQLTQSEWDELVANCDQLPQQIKHSSIIPTAFTQEGVAMLSGVLRSPIAIQVNITIMRAFVALRNMLVVAKEENKLPELIKRIETLEEISEETLATINDLSEENRRELDEIYIALSELASRQKTLSKPRNPIGYTKKQ
ncbi:ORF6N domain-containing protein [Parabacteroides sp. PF5-9]|uniref:ORF6N domain-containing protein n=1 Tax=Parabacteroides sp. PF5-9 TaxID=1742404 RepID=UPI002474DB1F|nr:ORF6N domain-containing protein [Parabacteroides sp. PF5-9]MDH6359053.1 hypothetical protein [Parabacteroides sp. PF5-9]